MKSGGVVVAITGLALVVGTVFGIVDGHDGTPAVTVLDSQPSRASVPPPASVGSCVFRPSVGTKVAAVHVVGACTGTLSGAATCGDATGSVALTLQTTAGRSESFSLIIQFANDPIGTGRQPASLFAEVADARGFFRWSDRSTTVRVSRRGSIDVTGLRLPPEAGTGEPDIGLSGSTYCASSS